MVVDDNTLKAVCHRYYNAQLSLRRTQAELQATEHQLHKIKHLVRDSAADLLSVQNYRSELESKTESRLVATTAAEDEEMEKQKESQSELLSILRRELNTVGRTLATLEDSKHSQLKFNVALKKKLEAENQHIRSERERLSKASSAILHEQQLLVKDQRKLAELQSSVASHNNSKRELQLAMKNCDLDATRLRHDSTLANRLFLSEIDFSRQQSEWIVQLRRENDKLKTLAQYLGVVDTNTKEEEGSVVSAPVDNGEPSNQITTPPITSVTKLKEYNLGLLRQLVQSVYLLHQQQSR